MPNSSTCCCSLNTDHGDVAVFRESCRIFTSRNEEFGRCTYITKKIVADSVAWRSASLSLKSAGDDHCQMEQDPSHAMRLDDNTIKRMQITRQDDPTAKAPCEQQPGVPHRVKWDGTIDETDGEHVRHHAISSSSGDSSSTDGYHVEMRNSKWNQTSA